MDITIFDKWAQAMTDDCAKAQTSITISAISCLPPLGKKGGIFGAMINAWKAAAQRGCKVTIYLPTPQKAHPATVRNAHTAETLHAHGIQTRFIPPPNLLHAKTCIIDHLTCWIGSGNFTAAAAHHNHEIYVRFDSKDAAQKIETRWQTISGESNEN